MRKDKDSLKIQAWRIEPITPGGWNNIPSYFRRLSDGLSKKPLHVIKVKYWEINTRDKLIWVIRKHYGFGVFWICFWNRWIPNKKFKRSFVCRTDKCPFKKKGKCNNPRFYSIYKNHDGYYDGQKVRGWSCRLNPKFTSNWSRRAAVHIMPNQNPYTDKDYEGSWIKKYDKMRYFRWFWLGDK